MKKLVLVVIVFMTMLALTACGSTKVSGSGTASPASLSLEGQLLVGTFRLENTELAVTADQAAELLPLWQALQSLADSDIAASQEVEAVITQIEDTMTPGQIDSITAMKLTQDDLAAALSQVGNASGNSSSTGTSSSSSVELQANAGMGAPGGGNPPTDMGGGGMAFPAGGESASVTQASATRAVTAGTSTQVPTALISSLVELLKKKIG